MADALGGLFKKTDVAAGKVREKGLPLIVLLSYFLETILINNFESSGKAMYRGGFP